MVVASRRLPQSAVVGCPVDKESRLELELSPNPSNVWTPTSKRASRTCIWSGNSGDLFLAPACDAVGRCGGDEDRRFEACHWRPERGRINGCQIWEGSEVKP